MSRFAFLRLGAPLAGILVFTILVVTGAPAQADPYFKFFWSEPDAPPRVTAIAPDEVRAILRREGARMVGAPRLRGLEIIATGRNASGEERRFVLDAETGEVLTVKLSRAAPDRSRPPVREQLAPGHALGSPVHPAGPLDADHLGTPLPPPPPEQVMPPPPPRQVEAPPPPPAEDSEPPEARLPDPDAALSPIKPQRPPGAPKVEKLPQ